MAQRLGAKTTAEQALQGISLKGKTAVVTGANSGIGVETTRVLALAGANVVMGCRSVASGEKVAAELRASLPAGSGTLEVRALDLANLESVKAFAATLQDSTLNLLINNAGIMASPLGVTAQGLESQLGTNHVGHFALTMALLPALTRGAPSRIVTVSSTMHTRGSGARVLETLEGDPTYQKRSYSPFGAYGDSKLANVLFTRHLAKQLPAGVTAYSLHPGVIATNLSKTGGVGGAVFRFLTNLFGKTVAQGAATTVYAATAPELATQSGVYLADCAVKASSPAGRDDALAAKVWALTEQRARG